MLIQHASKSLEGKKRSPSSLIHSRINMVYLRVEVWIGICWKLAL